MRISLNSDRTRQNHTRRNRLTSIRETELVINSLPDPGPGGFSDEFYQTFKEKIISIFYNLFQRMEAVRMLPNPLYEASIALILKQDKGIKRKKLQTNTSHVYRCKNPQQNIANIIQQCTKKYIHLTK